MTDWGGLHTKLMERLHARVLDWRRIVQACPPHDRRASVARVRFWEAFYCWMEARALEAEFTGYPPPLMDAEIHALLGSRAPDFAIPVGEET